MSEHMWITASYSILLIRAWANRAWSNLLEIMIFDDIFRMHNIVSRRKKEKEKKKRKRKYILSAHTDRKHAMNARPPVSLISAQCNKTCLASWCTGQNSSMHAWLKICPGHLFFFSCFSALRLFHDTRLLSSSRKRKEKHVLLHAPDLCTAGCICCCAMHQSTYSHSDQGFFQQHIIANVSRFLQEQIGTRIKDMVSRLRQMQNCCKCSPSLLFCTGLSFKCHGKANTGLQIGGKRIHRKSRSFENAQGKYTARRPEQKCI